MTDPTTTEAQGEQGQGRYFTSRSTGRLFVYCRYEWFDKSVSGGFVLYDRKEAEEWVEQHRRDIPQARCWIEPA